MTGWLATFTAQMCAACTVRRAHVGLIAVHKTASVAPDGLIVEISDAFVGCLSWMLDDDEHVLSVGLLRLTFCCGS